MNGILRATAEAIPKSTIYRVAAGVALGAAALALGFAFFFRPSMGTVVRYVVWPLLATLLAWVIAGVLRLRLVGYLPSQPKDDDYIPRGLQPWIRFWLLARFGLLGAMLALSLAVVVTAVARRGVNYAVEALVYVVMLRMFMDVGFGAAFNLGIITRRRSPR
jgi:hypothetical protein